MAQIVTRVTSGVGATVNNAPLTNTQLDTNFLNINSEIHIDSYSTVAPTLNLDFLYSKGFDPRIAFSRDSTATYFNSSGTMVLQPRGLPRIDYDPTTLKPRGLLMEEPRTNLVVYSNNTQDTVGWNNSGTPTVTSLSIDGLFYPTRVASSGVNWHRRQSTAFTLTSGVTYVITVLYKAGTSNSVWCQLYGDATNNTAVTGSATAPTVASTPGITVTGSPTVVQHYNGLIALSFVVTPTTTLSYSIGVGPNSTTIGQYIDFYGAQVEQGTIPTSFIVTHAVQGLRNRDTASISTIDSWYNPLEGTVVAEFTATLGISQGAVILSGANNFNFRVRKNSSNNYTAVLRDGTTRDVGIAPSPALTNNQVIRIALGVKTNDCEMSGGGQATVGQTLYTLSTTINLLELGGSVGLGENSLNGWLRKVVYYPKRFNASQLQLISL